MRWPWGRRTKAIRSQLSTNVRDRGDRPTAGVPHTPHTRISQLLHNSASHGTAAVPGEVSRLTGCLRSASLRPRTLLPVSLVTRAPLLAEEGSDRIAKRQRRGYYRPAGNQHSRRTRSPRARRLLIERRYMRCELALSNPRRSIVDGAAEPLKDGHSTLTPVSNGPFNIDAANKCQRGPEGRRRTEAAPCRPTVVASGSLSAGCDMRGTTCRA